MKKTILTLLGIVIATLILVSCTNSDKKLDSEIVASFEVGTSETIGGTMTLQVYKIDGCEYLFAYSRLAHKGNCTNPIHCYNE